MSTRALRKLQREQEIERQIAAATAAYEAVDESEEEEEETVSQPRNAFDMLNDVEGDESESEQSDSNKPSEQPPAPSQHPQPSKARKKRKKQKKKAKDKTEPETEIRESEDEIDRALRELAEKDGNNPQYNQHVVVPWEAKATKLLAIEQRNLNPTNEMRSLFGNIALENHETRATPRNQRRREANLQGGVDLGTALTGRYSVASRGRELGTLAARRNCFMQGKEEWPLATSGGLSMEYVAGESFEKQYNIMHNKMYRDIQMQFRLTVESMQADRMIGLLVANPYHVATLLQVSEIAKHQGDHSVSGDLLERALFSIGRSVHSSFPASLREGIARLDFNKPANRELYLTIWRYLRNLEMRGTWRTAFEWAKVILQFNTLSDPYGITLMIDQLAIRGRQYEQLLELASDQAYGNAWRHLPNIQISLALAHMRLQRPRDARRQLAVTMHQYPYVLSALASALDITPLPKALWGKLPTTDAEKLYTELYVTRAKDLWNTPETTSLIGEVAETLEHYQEAISAVASAPKLEISLEEARHIMLLELPPLIALLPRKFTNMATSSSDVLPPPTSLTEFTARAPTDTSNAGANALQGLFAAAGSAAGAPIQGAHSVLQRVLNWFNAPAGRSEDSNLNETGESEGQAAFRAMREHLQGENPDMEVSDELVEQMIRMHLQGTNGDADDAVDPAGLGMAGGWDYYVERAEATSDEEDHSSMPDLEDVPQSLVNQQASNPRAATVEEAEEDEDQPRPSQAIGRSVLRHVDSDDEDAVRPHPSQPNHTIFTPVVSGSNAAANNPSTTSDAAAEDDIINTTDPQRLQRWLITSGLARLRSSAESFETIQFYVQRLRILRKQQQDWILNIIQQQAGKDLADKVRAVADS